MKSVNHESSPDAKAGDTVWRRLCKKFMRALSDLIEASEPKRKRPRNLYIKGMTSHRLVTRPYSE